MTNPKSPALNGEDWSIRARRGELREPERALFERALEEDATLRAAHSVGRDFDAELRVQPGDDALVLRASARALEGRRRRAPRKRRLLPLLAAALVLAASGALAATAISRLVGPGSHEEDPAETVPAAAPPRANDRTNDRTNDGAANPAPATATGSDHEPDAPKPLSEPRTAARGAETAAPTVAPSATSKVEHSAASLFREASAARRAGDFTAAKALYTELQASFPATTEARTSKVSLGKLLLATGDGRSAERQFREYLASGGGALSEEALVGRADALQRLGESGEERRVWQELRTRYPSSVYAARARTRLTELGR